MKKHMKRLVSIALTTSLALSICSISVAAKDTNIIVGGGGDTNINVGVSGNGASASSAKKEEQEPFIDVNESDWFYDYVVKVYKEGLMEGTFDTEFSPYARLTRGMVATILYRLEGSPNVTFSKLYDDLEDNQWYTDGVIWATENQVLYGYGNGLCGPEDYVTIEQLAAILYRYSGSPEISDEKIKDYADYETITPYAVDAMEWACENDMLVGTLLHPTSVTLRAEAAKMFAKILDLAKL